MYESITQISGWAGTACILLAYGLVSLQRMDVEHPLYLWLNLLGALALGWNVYSQQSWPALALEVVWGIIALIALLKKLSFFHSKKSSRT